MSHEMMVGFLVVSLLLNVAVGALLYLTRKSATDYQTCMADWQQQFSKANKARSDAAALADQAQQRSWDGLDDVINQIKPDNGAVFAQALNDFRMLRSKQRSEEASQAQARSKNPLPELPQTQCGNPKEIRR